MRADAKFYLEHRRAVRESGTEVQNSERIAMLVVFAVIVVVRGIVGYDPLGLGDSDTMLMVRVFGFFGMFVAMLMYGIGMLVYAPTVERIGLVMTPITAIIWTLL